MSRKQPGEETHHLVPKGEYATRSEAARQRLHEAQARLRRLDIGADDGANGIFLPKADHRSIHTDKYFEALNDRLANATTREEALEGLRKIREQVSRGDFPH